MHIIFFNPQGNFDQNDSHMTEHPDFGGQLIYVKEVAMAMAEMGHKVDIITRQIIDPTWPEFANPVDHYEGYEDSLRIIRIACGEQKFIHKEALWPHMEEFVHNTLEFYGDELPDFATAHYADGGYCAVLARKFSGLQFTFTGHSLGAQKLDKLGTNIDNAEEMEERYRFSRRIAAERLSMQNAFGIITSTDQERREQYSHPLYSGAVNVDDDDKFYVIPPGVNTRIFSTEKGAADTEIKPYLDRVMDGADGPSVLVSSRIDEKKNILGVVKAYVNSKALQAKSSLVICVRGVDDPFAEIAHMPEDEQKVMQPVLDAIDKAGLRSKVRFLNIGSQAALAATYRYLADKASVFALTAFYEPFGLAPIEAAACGLACVATMHGGPSEVFADGSGILVDPFDAEDIERGILQALENYAELSGKSRKRVAEKYTWHQTAKGYLQVIEAGVSESKTILPDAGKRINDYLRR
jgi:sucrose-phosphate synthase